MGMVDGSLILGNLAFRDNDNSNHISNDYDYDHDHDLSVFTQQLLSAVLGLSRHIFINVYPHSHNNHSSKSKQQQQQQEQAGQYSYTSTSTMTAVVVVAGNELQLVFTDGVSAVALTGNGGNGNGDICHVAVHWGDISSYSNTSTTTNNNSNNINNSRTALATFIVEVTVTGDVTGDGHSDAVCTVYPLSSVVTGVCGVKILGNTPGQVLFRVFCCDSRAVSCASDELVLVATVRVSVLAHKPLPTVELQELEKCLQCSYKENEVGRGGGGSGSQSNSRSSQSFLHAQCLSRMLEVDLSVVQEEWQSTVLTLEDIRKDRRLQERELLRESWINRGIGIAVPGTGTGTADFIPSTTTTTSSHPQRDHHHSSSELMDRRSGSGSVIDRGKEMSKLDRLRAAAALRQQKKENEGGGEGIRISNRQQSRGHRDGRREGGGGVGNSNIRRQDDGDNDNDNDNGGGSAAAAAYLEQRENEKDRNTNNESSMSLTLFSERIMLMMK
eukprot:gene5671-11447_t